MTRIAGSDCEFMLISIHSTLNKDCTSRESAPYVASDERFSLYCK